MPKIFSNTVALDADVVDAFCVLQKGFADQFVYYDKERRDGRFGLGRCIALHSLSEADVVLEGNAACAPVFFSFNRFDAENPKPADGMMASFPRVGLMLPELVLIKTESGSFLQVNSLGPVYQGRVERFCRHAREAAPRTHRAIAHEVEFDSRADWEALVAATLARIEEGRIDKLVPSRRVRLVAEEPFSSKDVLVNLIDGDAVGTVFMYRYGDVFFCGCTPELLVRKRGCVVESMCLAGTCPIGADAVERDRLAAALLADGKNRREHEHVVRFMREVFARNCYDVDIPAEPIVRPLRHVQHLFTPVRARVVEGKSLMGLARQLHPTPALAGTPIGEALMVLRSVEGYNRGFFGGAVGYVDADGDGELSVAIRSGVFDGEAGWLYAGCGVVEGSDAAPEYDETNLKLKTILSAFDAPVAVAAGDGANVG